AAMFSGDVQVDTFVRAQSEIDSKYEATKVDLEGITSQLNSLRAELQRQTPAADGLRQARAELDQFRMRYTDENPLVIERVDKVKLLEEQLKKETAVPSGSVTNFADYT